MHKYQHWLTASVFILFLRMVSVVCGVRLSRSSSSNAGRGEITEATLINCSMTAHWHTHKHTEAHTHWRTHTEAHTLTHTHWHTHTQKGHRRYTGRSTLSLSLSHTEGHMFGACARNSASIGTDRKSVDGAGEASQASEDNRTTCRYITTVITDWLIHQCARDHKRCLDPSSLSLFRPLLFPSLVNLSVAPAHKHDDKSLSHRSAVAADLTSIYVMLQTCCPGDTQLKYSPQMFHVGGQKRSVKIWGRKL